MKIKKRLDVLLLEQGYADTRSKAQAIIMSGLVYVDGQKADKPGMSFEETVEIEVRGATCPYVSRGGLKLEKALRDFGVNPEGYVCSDSGASTGGFTQCLLKRGVKKVFAIDVGHGQMAKEIADDDRVELFEDTNARDIYPQMFSQSADIAVMDVSFISQTTLYPALFACTDKVVALVKPQFELEKRNRLITYIRTEGRILSPLSCC